MWLLLAESLMSACMFVFFFTPLLRQCYLVTNSLVPVLSIESVTHRRVTTKWLPRARAVGLGLFFFLLRLPPGSRNPWNKLNVYTGNVRGLDMGARIFFSLVTLRWFNRTTVQRIALKCLQRMRNVLWMKMFRELQYFSHGHATING